MTDQRVTGNDGPRRLILLGSTGSIGVNTVQVIEHLQERHHLRFQVVGLAAGRNGKILAEQARRLGAGHVALADPTEQSLLPDSTVIHTGADSARQLVEAVAEPGDLVVGAMVGAAGIPATLAAIERGCDIALANKETLVAAGALVMPAVAKHGVRLLPIDSEHSAIFQCLLAGRSISEVRKLVITASGGPFRTWSVDKLAAATVDEALQHPTWSMGPKVTIDSATMMNKALEIVEAHWLFGLPAGKIEAIVHPQSIVHSFVEFIDGSVLAQLGPPDMRIPIQYTLTWPDRAEGGTRRMDFAALRSLHFEPVDGDRFGAVALAGRVIERGGTAGAIFNGANEAAVTAFLERRIGFRQITELVADTLDAIDSGPVHTMDDIVAADEAARAHVTDQLAGPVGQFARADGR